MDISIRLNGCVSLWLNRCNIFESLSLWVWVFEFDLTFSILFFQKFLEEKKSLMKVFWKFSESFLKIVLRKFLLFWFAFWFLGFSSSRFLTLNFWVEFLGKFFSEVFGEFASSNFFQKVRIFFFLLYIPLAFAKNCNTKRTLKLTIGEIDSQFERFLYSPSLLGIFHSNEWYPQKKSKTAMRKP